MIVRIGWIALAAAALSLAGCPGGYDASGGPYFEFTPGTDIDLGEVLKDSDVTQAITIANVWDQAWEMELNEGSIPNNVEFTCDDGEVEECLDVGPYGEHTWTLTVHTFCDDQGVANIRLFFFDPESAGHAAGDLGDVTLTATWTTTGCS